LRASKQEEKVHIFSSPPNSAWQWTGSIICIKRKNRTWRTIIPRNISIAKIWPIKQFPKNLRRRKTLKHGLSIE